MRNRLRELNREVAAVVLNDLIEEMSAKYGDTPGVLAYLDAVRRDVNDHLGDFLAAGEKKHQAADGDGSIAFVDSVSPLRRYQVNLLVDSADVEGAPVIYESNPTYTNLTGRGVRVRTRDVQLDGGASLAVAWEFWQGGDRALVVNGVLAS